LSEAPVRKRRPKHGICSKLNVIGAPFIDARRRSARADIPAKIPGHRSFRQPRYPPCRLSLRPVSRHGSDESVSEEEMIKSCSQAPRPKSRSCTSSLSAG
jgi:hypothetical protein